MSYSEWTAAIEGLRGEFGLDPTPLSWEDFSHLRHRMGPTESIRENG